MCAPSRRPTARNAHRTIILSGPDGYGKRVPPERLGPLLTELTPTVHKTICMRFVGRSTARGQRPPWLAAASDVRLVDYDGNGSTVLHFEAPIFGEAAPDLYDQGELWPTRPAPDLTGFDLLAELIAEISHRNRDSDAFDRPLLRQIAAFKTVFDRHIDRLTLGEPGWTPPGGCELTHGVVTAAEELRDATPSPRRVHIIGRLDMLWESRRAFRLLLAGEPAEVRGGLIDGDIAAMRSLFGRQVMVEGQAVYRASGRVLRIDAERITASPGDAGIWDRIPGPIAGSEVTHTLRTPQTPRSGVNAITWISCWLRVARLVTCKGPCDTPRCCPGGADWK